MVPLPAPAAASRPLAHWASLLVRFSSVQVAVQGIGFLAGLAVVRFLAVEGYALYTLALTGEALLLILVETGSASVLSGTGGKVHADPTRFGALLATALRFRARYGAVLVVLAAPLLLALLLLNGAGPAGALLAVAAVSLSFWFRGRVLALVMVPRLLLATSHLQRVEIIGAACRLAGVLVAALATRHYAWIILFSVLGPLVQERLLVRFAAGRADLGGEIHPGDRADIVLAFRHQLLNAVYFAAQGQITVWLITVFGSTQQLAELGALGRLSALFALITAVLTNLVLPRFARVQASADLVRLYFHISGAVLLVGLVLFGAAVTFPDELLWILGRSYAHLEAELTFIMAASVWHLMVSTAWVLNVSRGWTQGAWLYVPGTLLIQVGLLWTLELGTLRGVILFGALSQLPTLVLSLGLTWRGVRQLRRSELDPAHRPAGR